LRAIFSVGVCWRVCTKVSFDGFDGADSAAIVIRDLAICEASLLNHAPNACVLPSSKIWRHLWLTRSAAGCVCCCSGRGCESCGSSRIFSLRLFPHPSTNEHRSHIHLGQCNTAQTDSVQHFSCRVPFFMQECRPEDMQRYQDRPKHCSHSASQNPINLGPIVAFSSVLHVQTHEIRLSHTERGVSGTGAVCSRSCVNFGTAARASQHLNISQSLVTCFTLCARGCLFIRLFECYLRKTGRYSTRRRKGRMRIGGYGAGVL
jgi:hypothetical protein